MPTNVNYQVPWNPQESTTQAILHAIQLANEMHVQQQQLGIEQQQANTQQQGVQQQAPLIGAQTAHLKAETAANLPAAQAEAAQARAHADQIQSQLELENNPLNKRLLRGKAREQNANAALAEARVSLLTNPEDFSAAVDQSIDPRKYPELNSRTKKQMQLAKQFQAFDPEAPMKVLSASSSEISIIERETDPNVIAARVKQTVDTQRALYGGGAVSGVAPHLVPAATTEATKLGTEYATFAGQMKNLRTQLAAAKTGNEVAAAFTGVAASLGSNAFYGTHRFSPTELQVLDNLGSIPRRIDAWFEKNKSGTLAPDTVKEFGALADRLLDAKKSSYLNGLKVVNKNYGSTFEPVDFGEPPSIEKAIPAGPRETIINLKSKK